MTIRNRKGFPMAVGLLALAVLAVMHMFASPSLAPYGTLTLPAEEATPAELHARFFGVSTILFSDGTTSIMVDGFFSRPSLLQLATQKIGPDDERIRYALDKGGITGIDALLIAHTHHDHALDSVRVAQMTGATLLGSASLRRIADGQNFGAAQVEEIKARDIRTFDQFRIEFFESPHAPGPGPSGVIDEPISIPDYAWKFKADKNYAYLLRHPEASVLIVPSANFSYGNFRGVCADIVFLGIGGLGRQRAEFVWEYWRETVSTTGARTVILIHWDDFTRPLDTPLRAFPYLGDDLEQTMERLQALATAEERRIYFMPLFAPISLRTMIAGATCPRY